MGRRAWGRAVHEEGCERDTRRKRKEIKQVRGLETIPQIRAH